LHIYLFSYLCTASEEALLLTKKNNTMEKMNFQPKGLCSFSVVALCSTMFITSCVNSISENGPNAGSIPINLSTSIQSRVANSQFEQQDTIGVYLLSGDERLSTNRYLDNEPFSFKDANPISKEALFYPYDAEKCSFFSYFPFRKEAVASGSNSMIVSVASNQITDKNFNNSDFMVANTKDITPSKKAVQLTHQHKFSLINVVLEPNVGTTAEELLAQKPEITFVDLYTRGTYNIEESKLTDLSVVEDIIPHGEWKVQNNTLTGKSAIVIPQTVSGDVSFVKLKLKERELIFNMGTELSLEADKENTLTIPCSDIKADNLTVSIQEWGKGTDSKMLMQYYNEGIALACLPFNQSKVCNVYDSNDQLIGQICKEYLLSDNIDAQAIVAYRATSAGIDKTNGKVLKLIGKTTAEHGGNIVWDKENNTLSYTAGKESVKAIVYVDNNNNFVFSKPENKKSAKVAPFMLVDKRGDETKSYPIVKIGTQYWMAENLAATKDSEGKDYPREETLPTNENKACYLSKNTAIFYNFAFAESSFINVDGWELPDKAAWQKLITYIKDDVRKIRSSSWNYKTEYATDFTGFNAKGVGFVSEYNGQGILRFEGVGTTFWYKKSKDSKTGRFRITGLNEQTKFLDLDDNDNTKACSIRLLQE
jgi:uncharacterized protein (TIGR02145 family)